MIIEIARLSPDGEQFTGEESFSVLGLEQDKMVRGGEPLTYDLFVRVVSHRLIVKGSVVASIELECARCAGFFSTMIEDSSFLRDYDLSGQPETVDITEDIREAILLLLPTFPVCDRNCRGLCPQCGQNLNMGDCKCGPLEDAGPWKGLAQLNIGGEG